MRTAGKHPPPGSRPRRCLQQSNQPRARAGNGLLRTRSDPFCTPVLHPIFV